MGNKRKDDNANGKTADTTNRTVSCTFRLRCRENTERGDQSVTPPYQGNIPRVSRLMALALRFDRLLRDGVVDDYTELAQLNFVTKPRISQVMSLLHLSPLIIDELLKLDPIIRGRDRITERNMRPIYAEIYFDKQEMLWSALKERKRLCDHPA